MNQHGQRRNDSGGTDLKYRIKPHDLVYFITDSDAKEVQRLSLSQIWRDDIKETIGEKFGGGNLVPLVVRRKTESNSQEAT